MRLITAPITWMARVLLWLFLWPVGLWRSVRHGRKKTQRHADQVAERRHREMLQAVRRQP